MNLPVFPSHPECRDCGRWELAPRNAGIPTTTVGVPGRDALVVVMPSPGYYEHLHNAPASGKPGRLLRDILLAELSTLCTIYLTCLVRCGVDQDTKSRDFTSCFPHHLTDIHAIWRQFLEGMSHVAHRVPDVPPKHAGAGTLRRTAIVVPERAIPSLA